MRATATSKAPVDPHAGCPKGAVVWSGTEFECRNHPTPQVVSRPREPQVMPGSPADHAARKGRAVAAVGQVPHVGTEAVAGLVDQVGKLRGEVGAMDVDKLRAEVTQLRTELDKRDTGAPLKELVAQLVKTLVDGGKAGPANEQLTELQTTVDALRLEFDGADLKVAFAHVNDLRAGMELVTEAVQGANGLQESLESLRGSVDGAATVVEQLRGSTADAVEGLTARITALEDDE